MTRPIASHSSVTAVVEKDLLTPQEPKKGSNIGISFSPLLPQELLDQVVAHINDEETLNNWILAITTFRTEGIDAFIIFRMNFDKEENSTIGGAQNKEEYVFSKNFIFLLLLKRWLPEKLQNLALRQKESLREAALSPPLAMKQNKDIKGLYYFFNATPLTHKSYPANLINRYIDVLPNLQTFSEFEQVIENLSFYLTQDEKNFITEKEKLAINRARQMLAKNLTVVPFKLWKKAINLCLSLTEKDKQAFKESEKKHKTEQQLSATTSLSWLKIIGRNLIQTEKSPSSSNTTKEILWLSISELIDDIAVRYKEVINNSSAVYSESRNQLSLLLSSLFIGISNKYLSEDWRANLSNTQIKDAIDLLNKNLPTLPEETSILIAENLVNWPIEAQEKFYIDFSARIDKLVENNDYYLLILTIQNLRKFPFPMQNLLYLKIVQNWLYKNTSKLLPIAIESSREWHYHFIMDRNFFYSVKKRFLQEMTTESAQPILILLIRQLPYWRNYFSKSNQNYFYSIRGSILISLEERILLEKNSDSIKENLMSAARKYFPDILPYFN